MGRAEASWSGMRKYLEQEMIAPAWKGRVRYHCSTGAGMDGCRFFEMYLDGVLFKRFSWETVNSWFIGQGLAEKPEQMSIRDYWADFWALMDRYPPETRTEYTDGEFCRALEAYRSEDIRKSIRSENPLVAMFALFDRRVGKRTLEKLRDEWREQPEWLRELYIIRTGCEIPDTNKEKGGEEATEIQPEFWETCWQNEDRESLFQYLASYRGLALPEFALFRQQGVKTVCDAACGFGAYTLALLSNGFAVKGFDISETAVEITAEGLKAFGYAPELKRASVLDTGYPDGAFDAALAYSVLDHMRFSDAQSAVEELFRIIRPGGLVMLSFDTAEAEDYAHPHEVLPDGSLRYTEGSKRAGMIFCPYDDALIRRLTEGREVLSRRTNQKGNQIIVLKKP